ncbi:MAG: DNA/RNA non-specific endonuclease [Flavobacteriales bacterium]|nr:DNA/RNA non-specific endonuclease [Flavobacteriales bacterium]
MRSFFSFLLLIPIVVFSQTLTERITKLEQEIELVGNKNAKLNEELNDLKLEKIREDLHLVGMPETTVGEEIICHSAMCLVYEEKYEQAKWVAHIILPDIVKGKEGRTDDFRKDTLVKTGTADDDDYFLKIKQPDGKIKYDGFGYDRGHLAPSADFRWSKKALSESYYYSNMSPQQPDFNRQKWASLEATFREYVTTHTETQLYVVTGPILYDTLPKLERGKNKVTIPEFYYKVAVDLTNNKAIGFIMPNKKVEYPITSYAVTINDVEKITGINFFYQLNDSLEEVLESQKIIANWLPEKQKNDVDPIYQPSLPPGTFNTVVAKNHIKSGKTVTVTGTVVDAKETKNGHLFFNLDKSSPNQIFSVIIMAKNIVNFSYNPITEFMGKQLTVKGKLTDLDGVPTMFIEKESQVEVEQSPKMKLILE